MGQTSQAIVTNISTVVEGPYIVFSSFAYEGEWEDKIAHFVWTGNDTNIAQ